jgi:hypothetical protein
MFVRYVENKHPHFLEEFDKYYDRDLIRRLGGDSIKLTDPRIVEMLFKAFFDYRGSVISIWKEIKICFAVAYQVCCLNEPAFMEYRSGWWWDLDGDGDADIGSSGLYENKDYTMIGSVYQEMDRILQNAVKNGWDKIEVVRNCADTFYRFKDILTERMYRPVKSRWCHLV